MISQRFARRFANVVAIGLAILLPSLTVAPVVGATEIKVMSTVAMTATLDELKPKFEAATGHKVTIVYSVIADLRKRILSRAALDDLQAQGKAMPGSIVNLASSYVAIGVRAGAAKPDITAARPRRRSRAGSGSGSRPARRCR